MTASRFCVVIAALLAACGHEPPAVKTGNASVTLQLVPLSAKCIVITVAGSTVVTRQIDVAPEASSVYTLSGLPLGTDVFSSVAYDVACANIGSATPGWASDPVSAEVLASAAVQVTLTMHPVVTSGGAVVAIDFPPVVGPGVVTEFSLPADANGPADIVTGPDGALWFIDAQHVGHMSVAGAVLDWLQPPYSTQRLDAIAAAPDGNLWIGVKGGFGKVVPGSPSHIDLAEMTLPSTVDIYGMAVGPDGNVWFLEFNTPKGGVVSLSGSVNELALGADFPGYGIAAGSSGYMYFAANYSPSAQKGPQLAMFNVATGNVILLPSNSSPGEGWGAVIAGPDGAVWFRRVGLDGGGGSAIASWSGAGTVSYAVSAASYPARLCAGPDGNIWFTDTGTNSIGRLEPANGKITLFPVPAANSTPYGITAGPDGNVWFTELNVNKIGRITTR